MTSQWFHPRGTLARGEWDAVVDDTRPGWQHTGLRVGAAGRFHLGPDAVERMVIPLDARTVTLAHDGGSITLQGRTSVVGGPPDVAYLGIGTRLTIEADGRFAVAEAPADRELPIAVVRAAEVPVELRGAGDATREVHNFGVPGVLEAQNLIVCEVLTPAGNLSSYPPHKHDTLAPGHESRLEEIYYFETAGTGTFAAYSSPGHEITIDETVRSGDIALIPFGYHGPAAASDSDLYYLNVMAGPDPDRVWQITDDPAHVAVRESWLGVAPDARLPFGQGDHR